MTDEQMVKAKHPTARLFSGVVGGRTKYRIETDRKAIGGWRDTQEAAWKAAAARVAEEAK